ncbi:VolA/Pla-1 family phospholipase [Vibrio cortegadensis]|uniref:VolA/Pla-1 family phospholipase n=1 Tax=Vibrio cortegadensis TaxID=1328770 RepID=UPI00352DCE5E
MNKTFNLSLLCSAILLSGCGDNSESSGTSNNSNLTPSEQALLNQPTSVKFTLQGSGKAVPLPSYLLMDTTDGTLKLPTDGNESLTNPLAAMNTADGWSTSMPIVVEFEGVGFNPGLVTSGVSVIKLSKRLTDIVPGDNPILSVLKINDMATPDYAFTVKSNGANLYIEFRDSLDESSEYIFAITNNITDKNGDGIGSSGSYVTAKSKETIFKEGDLASVQTATHAVENIFSAAQGLTGVDPADIIYSSWFSTQSIGDSLAAIKGLTGLAFADGSNKLNTLYKIDPLAAGSVDLSSAYAMLLGTTQDFDDALTADDQFTKYISDDADKKAAIIGAYQAGVAGGKPEVEVTAGVVNLPYYLEKGANWNSQPMVAAMPSLAKIVNALGNDAEKVHIEEQLNVLGINSANLETDPKEQLKLVGSQLTLSNGTQLDPERIITRYNPVPQPKSVEAVNLLLFTQKGVKPTDIVIYQHGITSAKENAYAFAQNLAQSGVAVIAIDLPLHGQRSLDDQRSANADILAYINLPYLPVARDNVRQSEMDMMSVRAGLAISAQAGLFTNKPLSSFNPSISKVKALGHSLGGIVATTAVAAANKPIGLTDPLEEAKIAALYSFSSMSIQNTGGQISNLLLGSANYGSLIKHNVAYSGSPAYKNSADTICTSMNLEAASCFETLYGGMTSEQKAELDGKITQFGFATQTVLDTVDPYTNAADLKGQGLPIFMSQVDNDQTVPNSVPLAPFAGTEPLALKLDLVTIDSTSSASNAAASFYKYQGNTLGGDGKVTTSVASHSTFVAPQNHPIDTPYHADMQEKNANFLVQDSLTALPETNYLK